MSLALDFARRRTLNGVSADIITASGINYVNVKHPQNSKLLKFNLTVGEKSEADGRNIVIKGKNLFNPMREFQSGTDYLGNATNLKTGIDAGQMLFYGIGISSTVGSVINCATPNQYWIIFPVKENRTYAISKYIKNSIRFVDENLALISSVTGGIFTVPNGAKYVMYYCFNKAQSTSVQAWTLNDVIQNTQIEIGEEKTEYQEYIEPLYFAVPEKVLTSQGELNVALNESDSLSVNYVAHKVFYNGVDISDTDWGSELLSIRFPTGETYIEPDFDCAMQIAYYV